MESDVRQSTNQHGFCSEHWAMLYNSQLNRLGLGLTIHTHLNELRASLGQSLEKPSLKIQVSCSDSLRRMISENNKMWRLRSSKELMIV